MSGKVYVGIIIFPNNRQVFSASFNKEKVSQSLYKFFIHEDNIFSRVWSAYHSFEFEEFSGIFPEVSKLRKFNDRMRSLGSDIEYNEEFFDELIELDVIEKYIKDWGNYSFEINEVEML
jgi:hypothetical protein